MKTEDLLLRYNNCPVASTLLYYINPFYYYPTIYSWVFQVASYIQVFRQKSRVHISSPPYVEHALPNSPRFHPHSNRIRGRPINYELPITLFSPASCYLLPVGTKYFSSAPCSQTLLVSVFAFLQQTKLHTTQKEQNYMYYYGIIIPFCLFSQCLYL